MANILVVTKDVAEFFVYRPVVALLRERGHKVSVIAEGVSIDAWLANGETLCFGQPEPAQVDENKCRHDIIDCELALDELRPDLVLTGLGAPINLGERFGLAANDAGIKLGYVIDVWGAESRSSALPDFICTLDPFGQKKIEAYKPYQSWMPHIYITGSPAMDRLSSVRPDEYVSYVSARYGLVVLLAGQDESTTPLIDGLLEAMGRLTASGARLLLIPRLHPKFMHRAELVGSWLGALAEAQCDVLWVNPKVSTEQIMLSADVVASVYSNALVEAAALGSTPVSWFSDIGREKMREALGGIDRFPLVDYGCAAEVSSPEEFLVITSECRDAIRARCEEVFSSEGNTERVVAAIEAELQ